MEIQELAAQQRTYFNTGATRTAAFRRQALERLRAALLEREEELNAEYIMPYAFDERICPAVAKAVAEAARKSGVARI